MTFLQSHDRILAHLRSRRKNLSTNIWSVEPGDRRVLQFSLKQINIHPHRQLPSNNFLQTGSSTYPTWRFFTSLSCSAFIFSPSRSAPSISLLASLTILASLTSLLSKLQGWVSNQHQYKQQQSSPLSTSEVFLISERCQTTWEMFLKNKGTRLGRIHGAVSQWLISIVDLSLFLVGWEPACQWRGPGNLCHTVQVESFCFEKWGSNLRWSDEECFPTRWDMAKYPIKQSLKNLSEIISKQVSFKFLNPLFVSNQNMPNPSPHRVSEKRCHLGLLIFRTAQPHFYHKWQPVGHLGESDWGRPEEQVCCLQCPQI